MGLQGCSSPWLRNRLEWHAADRPCSGGCRDRDVGELPSCRANSGEIKERDSDRQDSSIPGLGGGAETDRYGYRSSLVFYRHHPRVGRGEPDRRQRNPSNRCVGDRPGGCLRLGGTHIADSIRPITVPRNDHGAHRVSASDLCGRQGRTTLAVRSLNRGRSGDRCPHLLVLHDERFRQQPAVNRQRPDRHCHATFSAARRSGLVPMSTVTDVSVWLRDTMRCF